MAAPTGSDKQFNINDLAPKFTTLFGRVSNKLDPEVTNLLERYALAAKFMFNESSDPLDQNKPTADHMTYWVAHVTIPSQHDPFGRWLD